MKQTIFLLLLTFMSCVEVVSTKETSKDEVFENLENTTNISHQNNASNSNVRYVNTTSNLNYRDAPDGEVLGKFKRNEKITVVRHSNIFKEITDEGVLVRGEWVGVLQGGDVVYVFDAFLSDTPVYSDVWSKFPFKERPFKDKTSFDNIDKSQRLTKAEIDELQLAELYPYIHTDNCEVYPSYQVDYGDFKSIVVNVFKNEHELESVLIIYDTDNTLHKIYQGEGEEPGINAKVIAYDEIAEGWSRKTAQFKNDCITIIDALYTDTPVIDTSLYHINRFGFINEVDIDFANNIRPNKPIKLGVVYTDTIQFSKYNDEGDYWFLEGKKNSKDIFLYYNWGTSSTKNYNFKKNDFIEVQWKMDSLYVAGDGETLFFSEVAIDAKKIEN